ncbi:hypothetical protein F5Y08DRAFT_17431 [Xylaria arbuscula]|nr:hypothetical protein F5Y08DRAFT_17431 [Xylaria arbuscula]
MLLRPPGDRRLAPSQRTMFLALAVLLIPLIQLVDAQQQQQQASQPRSFAQPPHFANIIRDGTINVDPPSPESRGLHRARQELPLDGHDRAAPKPPSTKPKNQARRPEPGSSMFATKQNPNDTPFFHDASALATLAPGKPVRAPNSPRPISSILARSPSLQSARNLENWEVEDYILLATVDGHLYSVDRESGDERWHLQVEQPVVETIHYRPNTSSPRDKHDDDYHPLDDYVWAIEPTHDGAIYVWTPSHYGAGLMSTGYTMKQFVNELDHYASSDPPVVFSGYKKSTPIILDAATGRVLRWYGPAGSQVQQSDTCYPPNSRLVDSQKEECAHGGTISLSRAEYIVEIHHRHTARNIATLKYAEWEPNKSDNDLRQQYRSPPDSRYFTSQHDGRVYAIADPASTTTFALEFPVPVARAFDVARPLDAPKGSDPELVLLPQPTPPVRSNEDSAWARCHSVFLNQTESGGWYAMSGSSYPLIVHGPPAPANLRKPWESGVPLDDVHLSMALVGVHHIGDGIVLPDWPLTMPATLPSEAYQNLEQEAGMSGDPVPTIVPELESELRPIVETVITLPRYALDSTRDLLTNPILVCVVMFLAYRYAKVLRAFFYSYWMRLRGKAIKVSPDSLNRDSNNEVTVELSLASPQTEEAQPGGRASEKVPVADKPATGQKLEPVDVPLEPEAKSTDLVKPVDTEQEAQTVEPVESPEKKKKNHRGRRGGVKHRKGAKKQRDAADESPEHGSPENGSPESEGSIPGIQNIGSVPKLEPNVMTAPNDPEDVSQSIININDIEVNQNMQLGTGSNGTVVFAGKFHGRNIAVKRMLSQFWDVAYQETRLLVDCDEHTNVIKYYSMTRNQNFLYIALELCEASLSDIIDRPAKFPDLARAGEMDLPRVLLQIANGLSFLHELRIVHRDLKPQNILVKMGRDGLPRLVVSDFGLCKKLEGGQSSFGATTAHAAGTSGWRAPELLLDDDAREANGQSMYSTHSDSSSQLMGADVVPGRRATRAIDIFSLGLVFYYVLTKGLHPFDCGDRYMREVNIRKGQFSLKQLEVLGDAAYEAKALIQTMLQADPRVRPSAKDVMAHPFFWPAKERLAFLCDVSDHFELEPRDPMSPALATLEEYAPQVCRGDFLKVLPKEFVESLGKQRKYTGTKFLDLLRALRNKRSHYGDLSDSLKRTVGPIPEGYLGFWTRRFPNLIIVCCTVIYKLNLQETMTFQEYFKARRP